MGDWLGTGNVALYNRQYRPYDDALSFVQTLGLKGEADWEKYCKGELREKGTRPDDIPAAPEHVYKNKGWTSWGNFLGTGFVALYNRQYRPFEEARWFAQELRLKNQRQWADYCLGKLPEKGTLPKDIPASPNRVYRNQGWTSLGDWLGTGRIASHLQHYRAFTKARQFVRGLKLTGKTEWHQYCRGELTEKGTRPDDLPANPNRTYEGKGWVSWGDWFGTGTVAPGERIYRSFEDARRFARGLGLKREREWRKYCRGETPEKETLPVDIPANPNQTYKDSGWAGMGDWLGTGRLATFQRHYKSFGEARQFVQGLKLTSRNEWEIYSKGNLLEKGQPPHDIPAQPNHVYKDQGWRSWGDWLGTGYVAARLRQYLPFEEARLFVQALGLKGAED